MSLTSYRAAPPRGFGRLDRWGAGSRRRWVWLCVYVCAMEVGCFRRVFAWLGRPGGDLLSRILRCSTMGAGGFHGRVRDGIGCCSPRHGHQVIQATRLAGRLCGLASWQVLVGARVASLMCMGWDGCGEAAYVGMISMHGVDPCLAAWARVDRADRAIRTG